MKELIKKLLNTETLLVWLVAIGFILYYILFTVNVDTKILSIDSFQWERIFTVEELKTEKLRTTDKADEKLPENARLKYTNLEISNYRLVKGSNQLLEPVFKVYYYYDVDYWKYKTTLITQGEDKNPYWDDSSLSQNERISKETVRYIIITSDGKGRKKKYNVDYENWCNLKKGQQVKVNKYILGYGDIIEYL